MHHPLVKPMVDIPKMASVSGDTEMARNVLLADHEVDALRDAVYAELLATMQRDPGGVPAAVDLIFVARNLERIGDHAANIAEDVVEVARAGSKVQPQLVVGVRDDPHLLPSTSHPK
jgi:phosphate transport system protein